MSSKPVVFGPRTAKRLLALLDEPGATQAAPPERDARWQSVDVYYVALTLVALAGDVTAGAGVTVAVSNTVGVEVGSVLHFDTEDVTVTAVDSVGSTVTADFTADHANGETFSVETQGRFSGVRYRYSATSDTFAAQDNVWIVDANDAELSPGVKYQAARAGKWNGRPVWLAQHPADDVFTPEPESGVSITNVSGGDLAQFAVVGLGDAISFPPIILGSAEPAADSPFAILQRAVADGDTGPARVSGDSLVSVYVYDDAHTYAQPIEGEYGHLASVPGSGPARILWKEAGLGLRTALVQFCCPCDCACATVPVEPAAASIVFEAHAPTISGYTVAAPAASMSLAANAPTIRVRVKPNRAMMRFRASVPLIRVVVPVPQAYLSMLANDPTISEATTIAPSAASMALAANAPTVAETVKPAAASLSVESLAEPTIRNENVIDVPVASLTFTANAPTITGGTFEGDCNGCEVMPTTYRVMFADITESACADCSDLNATHDLVSDGPGTCTWSTAATDPCESGQPLIQLASAAGYWYLIVNGVNTYRFEGEVWDCLGTNTMSAYGMVGSSNGQCGNFPATVDVAAV